MVKKNKEKSSNNVASSPKEVRSRTLKRYSLIVMLIMTVMILSFGVYVYMTTSYAHYQTVQKQNSASSEELMRKMKQMLDDEKTRLASLATPPPALEETNVSRSEELPIPPEQKLEQNASVETIEHNATTPSHKEEEPKTPILSEAQDYEQNVKAAKTTKHSEVMRKTYPAGTTPRLAIIIDDVSFPWQTRLIKEIPYKVTPSFFPPTKGHPETVRLSYEFEFAMIHLPMESKNYSSPEPDTLTTLDSSDVIEKRISRIKAWFPHIKYYNNHTGGTYTADYNAMDRLIKVMKARDLLFVDSRTIGNSKVGAVCKKYDMFCYSRDVFLDNSLDKSAIRTQLKEAVTKAKRNGYAIAIGHPHKSTLEVLKDSSDLLEGLDLVYLKDL